MIKNIQHGQGQDQVVTSRIDLWPTWDVRFYLSHGLVRVYEIELSHMDKITEIPIWCARESFTLHSFSKAGLCSSVLSAHTDICLV